MANLNAKQARFVQEYLIDLNGTQAAIRAGYSARTAKVQGSRLLTNAYVQQAVSAGKAASAKRAEITVDYVLNTICETIERCRQAEPVLDRQGHPVMVGTPGGTAAAAYTFNSKAVLQGCDLLGRHLAMWRDRVEHTGKDGQPLYDGYELARRMAYILDPPPGAQPGKPN